MTSTGKHLTAMALVSGLFALAAGQVFADLSVGDDATLLQSIDEEFDADTGPPRVRGVVRTMGGFAVPKDAREDRWISPCEFVNAITDKRKMRKVKMPYLPMLGVLTTRRGRKVWVSKRAQEHQGLAALLPGTACVARRRAQAPAAPRLAYGLRGLRADRPEHHRGLRRARRRAEQPPLLARAPGAG